MFLLNDKNLNFLKTIKYSQMCSYCTNRVSYFLKWTRDREGFVQVETKFFLLEVEEVKSCVVGVIVERQKGYLRWINKRN